MKKALKIGGGIIGAVLLLLLGYVDIRICGI